MLTGIVFIGLLASVVFGVEVIVPGTYREDGQPLTIQYDGAIDVYGLLGENCHLFKDVDACTEVMDGLSGLIYGITNYTPRLGTRTFEDYTTARWDVILSLIHRYNYTKYLEIGCARDEVFSRVRGTVSLAVGVDPSKGGTHRMTSNAFFESNTETFDIIFIDGDHNAKQAIRDVNNAMAVLAEGGTIVMHDCNPRTEIRQIPHDNPNHTYNGDVWKVVVLLRLLPDVEVIIIDIDHGIGVLRRRPNQHRLPEEFEQKLALAENKLEVFSYMDLELHRNILLRLMSVVEFRAWLVET